MKKLLAILLTAQGMLTANAYAAEAKTAQALAQKSGCLVCHGIENKIVGPG